jgi:hypothetical protein
MDRKETIKLPGDSFDYCAGIIDSLTDQHLAATTAPRMAS